jgi:hypothetical protein
MSWTTRCPRHLWPHDRQREDYKGNAIRAANEARYEEHLREGAPMDLSGYLMWLAQREVP